MFKINYVTLALNCLILLGACQETKAMHRSAQWLKDTGKFTASLATAMVCTHKYISEYKHKADAKSFYNRLQNDAKNNPQPQSETFVLETLHKAYPELTQQDIKIITNSKFSLATDESTHFLRSPLTDKELNFASELKKGERTEIPHTLVEQAIEKQKLNWSIQEWLANQELNGMGFTKAALDVWRCNVTHLGARIKNNDLKHQEALSHALTPAILFACIKNMQKFSPFFLASGLAAHFVTPTALHYWQTYRADQDTVKHIEDPVALRAMSHNLQHVPYSLGSLTLQERLLASYYKKVRAPYYAQAAEDLEKKLERT